MTKEKDNKDSDAEEQKKEIPLFRKEALQQKKGSYFGKNIIVTPISFSAWTIGITIIAVMLILFLYFGRYSKRQEVRGMLVPSKGLINVYAKNSGVVAKQFVKQGDSVSDDQLLYLISTEQHSLSDQGTVAQQVELLEKQIKLQESKLASSEKNLDRYKTLLDERILSEADYQKLNQEHLDVEYRLNQAKQELVNAKGSSDYAVRASTDGVVSNLIARVGDRVTAEKPLAVIIPSDAELEGLLFVPSSAIGFVKIGQKVLLKYDAYPHQNFGLYDSTVESIDKSILFPKDIDSLVTPDPRNPYAANEPFYRVIVKLKEQTVSVYGKPYPLTPGITLHGDMLGDKRNVWQWILDPIYTLKGSLTS